MALHNRFPSLSQEQRLEDVPMALARHGYQTGVPTQQYSLLSNPFQAPMPHFQGIQLGSAGPSLLHSPFADVPRFVDTPAMTLQPPINGQRRYEQLFNIEGLVQNRVPDNKAAEAGSDAVSEEEDVPIGRGLKRAKPSNPGLTQDGYQEVIRKHLESRKRLKLIQEGLEGFEGLTVKENGGLVLDLGETQVDPRKASPKKIPGEKQKRAKVEKASKGEKKVEGGAKSAPVQAVEPQAGVAAEPNGEAPLGAKEQSPGGPPPERKKRKYVRKQKPVAPIEPAVEPAETAVQPVEVDEKPVEPAVKAADPGVRPAVKLEPAKEEAAPLRGEHNVGEELQGNGAGETAEVQEAVEVAERQGQEQVAAPDQDKSSPHAVEAPQPSEVEAPPREVAMRPGKKHNPLDDITEESAGVLDLGWGVQFLIPPFYDDLAPSLGLPTFDTTQINEKLLAGGMRSAHLAALVKEEAERRAAQREALERAEAKRAAAARALTGTPTPSLKTSGRVPDGQRCSVCRAAKKGGCGSVNAHARCKKRALEGFPFIVEEQEAEGLKGLGDPLYFARAGAMQLLQSAHGQSMLGQLKGMFSPEQLAMMAHAGPGGIPLDALRVQAEMAASALAWQAMPQGGGMQTGPGVRPHPLQRTQSPQIDPAIVAKNEKLRLKLKQAKDPVVKEKEDTAKVKRLWQNMARRDIPKQHRAFTAALKKQTAEAKRVAELCQKEVKARCMRSQKLARLAGQRTRRLARDMVLFWRKMDKEAAEMRKHEEREAAAALRRQEEMREAKRQQQRLNFLLTQTELYSHFMRNQGIPQAGQPALERSPSVGTSPEDAEENARLQEEAAQAAQAAAARTQDQTSAFDSEVHRIKLQSADPATAPPDGSDNIDLLNPSTMPEVSTVLQPKMFLGKLKEYQLKGVQWLVNLYEQGLNGILADEMGLGKTIQAMSFLGHLAEEKGIWGPFIVVSPASTLPNWVDELGRFCPELKVLPYWGGAPERAVLRKNLNPKRLYRKDSAFHVCVTSYQLIVADEKYLKKVKWQYMVLDEAQAIKSASSQRWKTMLSFNCRNRLLLTGTPIQNNMAELWALLHFIMPTLFDSHEQFNEWFSKGIEGHAEGAGHLNEHQLTRLHAILKPFMLRRVKKDVESEMTGKKEVTIPCPLSNRQQALYRAIKNNISIADLFDGGASDKQMLRLMNIVIQLRKVCNHPELFERNEARLSYTFCVPPLPLQTAPFGELDCIAFPGCRNPVTYQIPKLLYREATPCLPPSASGTPSEACSKWLHHRLSIFSPDNIHCSIFHASSDRAASPDAASTSDAADVAVSGCFGFTRMLGLSPREVSGLAQATVPERWAFYWQTEAARVRRREIDEVFREGQEDPRTRSVLNLLNLSLRGASSALLKPLFTGPPSQPLQTLVTLPGHRLLDSARLLRSVADIIPPVQAPPIDSFCPDRSYAYQQQQLLFEPRTIRTLCGRARTSEHGGPFEPVGNVPDFTEEGAHLMAPLMRVFGASLPMQAMDFSKMLTDSGKLQALDGLLRRLRREGHRVLIFAQMTSMMNILEDYLNFRKFKYLRLDGSSSIVDRRDMVNDFQTRSDIFVFLLSTRAGGLGINLTAADTVIFFESDWNPTMDLQAMDRAHRLGQTKEVTVYRMICSNTVEERIVKRASQKSTVQQLVMTGQQAQADVFQPEEVMSLLLDDAELEQQMKAQAAKQPVGAQKKRKSSGAPRAIRMMDNGSDVAVADSVDVAREATPGTSGGKADVTSVGGDVTSSPPEQAAKKRRKVEGPKAPKPPKAPKARASGLANRKKGSSFVKEGSASFKEAPVEDVLAPSAVEASVQGEKIERVPSAGIRLKIRPPSFCSRSKSNELPVQHIEMEEGHERTAELQVSSPLVKPHMKRQRSKKRRK